MRITRQTLMKIAQDTVKRRVRTHRDVIAVYLHGSLLADEPVFGGTADIDLFIIHNNEFTPEREIERLTDEVHLDISHHERRSYHQARNLRRHPWVGPTLFGCKILYDPQHFLDFTQASVRGHFHRADNILARSRQQAEHARQVWLAFYQEQPDATPAVVAEYLRAVEHAANSLASLNGPPLPERRLLIQFPQRAEQIERPGLFLGLIGLLGGSAVTPEIIHSWLDSWEAALDLVGASPDSPPSLHPYRRAYYRRSFESMLESEQPLTCLWPLLRTWTRAVCHLPPDSPASAPWQEAFGQLQLLDDSFPDRVAALDAFLDTVEDTLDIWAQQHGA